MSSFMLRRDFCDGYWKVNVSVQPALASPQVKLIDKPQEPINNWHSPNATELLMEWVPVNLTGNPNARVDITLWAYWEDTDDHQFIQVRPV